MVIGGVLLYGMGCVVCWCIRGISGGVKGCRVVIGGVLLYGVAWVV